MATKIDVPSVLYEETAEPTKSLASVRMALARVEEFAQTKSSADRLTLLQQISQLSTYLPDETLQWLATGALQDADFRIRGEMCYALGRSGKPAFIPMLKELGHDPIPWVRQQAGEALRKLGETVPTKSDFDHLLDLLKVLEEHSIAKEVAIAQLSKAEPGDIQGIAASQIKLLNSYYEAALAQAKASFRWASIAAAIGIAFFLGAAAFLLVTRLQDVAIIGVIGGAIVEVISGINFLLYGKATGQLASFHQRLDQTQRFLLANSICEALEGDTKQRSRAELVTMVATLNLNQIGSNDADAK